MLPYWLLFLAFAAGAVLTPPTTFAAPVRAGVPPWMQQAGADRRPSHLLFTAAAIFAALMIGFRYRVGGDWTTYAIMFDQISQLDLWSSLQYVGSDPGYSLINWISALVGADIWGVNLVCGAIFIFGLGRFAKAQPNPWLAAVIAVPYLIIGVGMGYSRQAVAIGLVMAGFAALSKGSFRAFVLWTLAGAFFHRSAVVLLPIVGVSYARNRLQTVAAAAVASLVGYYVLLAPSLDRLSQSYIDTVYQAQGAGVRLGMNVPPAVIFLLFSRRFGLSEAERTTWRNLSLVALGVFGLYLVITSTVALDRIALYIIPLQLLVLSRLPIIFGRPGRQSGLLLALLLVYSAAIEFVWLNFANNALTWVPYRIYPVLSEPED